MAKLPPFAKQDPVDRSTFVRAPISISAPQGQRIASAAIEFGYTGTGRTFAILLHLSPRGLRGGRRHGQRCRAVLLRTDGNLHADAVREILHHYPARPAGARSLLSGQVLRLLRALWWRSAIAEYRWKASAVKSTGVPGSPQPVAAPVRAGGLVHPRRGIMHPTRKKGSTGGASHPAFSPGCER